MHSATELPLHGGKAPRWLFHRMVKLSRAISLVIMDEFGSDELVRRLSDPKELAYRDPVMYSYNLGGKDGIPFAINKKTYDDVIRNMEHVVDSANVESREKHYILKRLNASLAT